MTAIYDSTNTTSSSTPPPSLGLLDPALDGEKQTSPIAVEKVEQETVSDSASHRHSNRQDVREDSPDTSPTGVVTEVRQKTSDQNSTSNTSTLRTDSNSGIQYQYATITQGTAVQVPSGFSVTDPGSTSPMPIRVVQVHAVEEPSTAGSQSVSPGVGVAYSVGNGGVQLINPGEGTGTVANVTVENPADGTRYTYYPAVQSADSNSQPNQLYVMMSPQDMIPVTGASTSGPRIIAPRAHPLPQIADGTTFAVEGDHTLQVEFRKVESGGSGRSSRDERRRATHNEVERRRRDKINNWIMKLASIVPECQVDQVKQGQVSSAQSKGGILSKTVDYITKLRSSNERMAESLKEQERVILENQFLRQQVDDLRKENNVIRASMQLHMGDGASAEGEQVMETSS